MHESGSMFMIRLKGSPSTVEGRNSAMTILFALFTSADLALCIPFFHL